MPEPPPPPPDDAGRHLERVLHGRVAFNRGDFFLAHEHWEEVWLELVGPGRLVLQGLIQIAAGLHHLKEGRTAPAARLLDKGMRKLSPDKSTTPLLLAGLRIDALIRDVAPLLAALQARPGTTPRLSALEL
jgi:predicted metal-dependent hydrolase